jgi:hypothetical protein
MRPVGQFPQCIQSTLLCVASFYAVDTSTEMVDMFTKALNLQSVLEFLNNLCGLGTK